MSEEFLGLQSIPGFTKRNRGKEQILIPLLGFEGQRLYSLIEEIQPKTVIPVVGFPSYAPGWKFTAIRANSRAITAFDCHGQIRTCESSSPYNIYKLLNHLSKIYEGYNLLIAPLGTRPHAAGAAIYASLNSHCTLIYDFPIEKVYRSEGILRSNIYHLSRFIT